MQQCSENNNLFLAQLQRILVNSNENYGLYNFQALANISGKFTTLDIIPWVGTMSTGKN